MCLKIVNTVYDNPTANIITPNNGKLKAFPPRSRIGQRCLPLTLVFNILLQVLAKTIQQEKDIKDIQVAIILKYLKNTDYILCPW